MIYEVAIPFRRLLQGVLLTDPTKPLLSKPAEAAPVAYFTPVEQKLPEVVAPEAAMAEERQAIERVLDNLNEVGDTLRKQQRQRLDEMQQVAVELAVAIASRIVHDRITSGEYAVEEMVRKVVDQIEPGKAITIHLNPEDLNVIEQRRGQGETALSLDSAEVRFASDAKIARGDCRAETDDMCVVSNIDDQLTEIRRHLLGNLSNAEIERRQSDADRRNLKRFPDRRQIA